MSIAVVIGNPNVGGRTTQTAQAVAAKIGDAVGDHDISIVELGEHTQGIFEWEAPHLDALNAQVAAADLAIFACPTYKASFTGLLKAFLDRYDTNGLAGVVAVPVMLGAAPVHWLAPETQLRPVLVELAATVPSKSFFMIDKNMDVLDESISSWWELAEGPIRRSLGVDTR